MIKNIYYKVIRIAYNVRYHHLSTRVWHNVILSKQTDTAFLKQFNHLIIVLRYKNIYWLLCFIKLIQKRKHKLDIFFFNMLVYYIYKSSRTGEVMFTGHISPRVCFWFMRNDFHKKNMPSKQTFFLTVWIPMFDT